MGKQRGSISRSAGGRVWVAFFRGINVGGHNKLPMKALAEALESAGFVGVQTYIQSGNVVFRAKSGTAAAHSATVTAVVLEQFGFAPWVLVLPLGELAHIVEENPYPEVVDEPKSLHCFFLRAKPKNLDTAALDAVKKDSESYRLGAQVLYLHAPEGIGKSKLAERVERLLGVDVTARNWRTVCAVLALGADEP